jgi:hypothetical protein
VRFGSQEWLAAVAAALDAHPELPEALHGLGRDAAIVVEADPPAWPRTVAAWAEQRGGRIARWRLLDDEDEVLELEPAYVVRAPYRIIRSLLEGADPVQAALSGRVRVEGDLEALIRRVGYRHVLDDVLAEVKTELP